MGAFLLVGGDHREIFRTLGRWYGKAVRLKRDLLAEVTRAADLPPPRPGQPVSLRATLLGDAAEAGRGSGIPVAVTVPPLPVLPAAAPSGLWTTGFGPATWSTTGPVLPREEAARR